MEKVVSNPFGRCMMCHKSPIEVRHINLYPVGSEGFWCCRACEDKLLDFIREESRKATHEAIEKWKKKKKMKDYILRCPQCNGINVKDRDEILVVNHIRELRFHVVLSFVCKKCRRNIAGATIVEMEWP